MFRTALHTINLRTSLLWLGIVLVLALPTIALAQEAADPEGLGGVLYSIFTTIGGVFTWVGGGLLDYAVTILVIRMGDLLTGNIGVAVNTLWTVIRDLFNILFIFGLIWIGLQTILRIGSNNIQRTLGGLIVAALLINFSLFITKAIIDFSNIAATQIYTSGFSNLEGQNFDLVQAANLGGILPADEVASGFSISSVFMANMELNSFAAGLVADDDETDWINLRAMGYGFLVMVLQIIAGFVFLSGAILLIYRFIALVVYMIFSPAMFVGLIFDKFMTYQRKWWSGFFSNAFVAPAYLFMLYLSAAIFTGLNGTTQAIEVETFYDGYQSDSIIDGGFAIFLFFAVMAGFLIASTMVAKQMGAAGASTVLKVGGVGANTLRGLGRGSLNYGKRFGQNTGSAVFEKAAVGFRGKDYKAAEQRLKERRAKDKKDRTWKDNVALSYAVARGAGSLDDRQAALKKGQDFKPFGGKSFKEKQDAEKALVNQNAQQQERKALLDSIEGAHDKDQGDEFITMVDKITSSSPAEISQVLSKYEKEGPASAGKYQAVVNNLSPNQFKKVLELKEEDFNDKSKNSLRAARGRTTTNKLERDKNGNRQNLRAGLKQASVADLATLDFNKDVLANAAYLQGTQLDDLKKDDFFGGPRFEAIKKKHEGDLQNMLTNGNAATIISSRKGSTNIAKLPANILKDPAFIKALISADEMSVGLLSQIASSKEIDDSDKPKIGEVVETELEAAGKWNENYEKFFTRGVGQNLKA